jgi:epoxide hydrolase-like predicted phosphatase
LRQKWIANVGSFFKNEKVFLQVYFCHMINGIRHIIFDLGGVLLNINYQLTEQAFIKLGISDFPALYSQAQQSDLFDKFETGRVSQAEFLAVLQQLAGIPLTDAQIIDAWNAMLLDLPLRRLQLLQQLRAYHDLILLSNTNEIHETAFNKIVTEARGMSLAAFFDKVYLSHRVGMRKPDTEIFQRILEENGFKPEHTLFIDDSIQHIEGAKSLGIQTIHMEPGMTIEDNIFLPKKD